MKNVLKKIFGKKQQTEKVDKELSHPERLAVLSYCQGGKGLDIGCGNRKTDENCIGVDIVPFGEFGEHGCVKGKESKANICTSGDDLNMFLDNELDFIVARHNIEHYVDVVKTLKEWRRVLKNGGVMAVVAPDEEGLRRAGKRSVELDPTHEHSFTMDSFKNLLETLGGFSVVKLEPVVENWSFVCVAKKDDSVNPK